MAISSGSFLEQPASRPKINIRPARVCMDQNIKRNPNCKLRWCVFCPLSRMILPKFVEVGVRFGSDENTACLVALNASKELAIHAFPNARVLDDRRVVSSRPSVAQVAQRAVWSAASSAAAPTNTGCSPGRTLRTTRCVDVAVLKRRSRSDSPGADRRSPRRCPNSHGRAGLKHGVHQDLPSARRLTTRLLECRNWRPGPNGSS